MERNEYPRHWLGKIDKDTFSQLRIKEQSNGYNAGVAVKQQENTEKQQFVLHYRGNKSKEIVEKQNENHYAQTNFTTRKFWSCLPSLNSSFDRDPTGFTNSLVMDANPPMEVRYADIFPHK